MLTFAVGELPNSWTSVAAFPILLTLIAVGVWIVGRTAELKHGAKPWKWAAAFPMFLALILGWSPFMRMSDFIYRLAIEPYGTKMRMAHYMAFMLPVICVAALAGYEYWDRKRSLPED
jgi:hypothetical protein